MYDPGVNLKPKFFLFVILFYFVYINTLWGNWKNLNISFDNSIILVLVSSF